MTDSRSRGAASPPNQTLAPAGRCLFALIFVISGLNHVFAYGNLAPLVAARGVPFPALAVIGSGLLMVAGGLSVALGWRARLGAWCLVAFLVPTTLVMHRFWGLDDVGAARGELVHFLKNVSLLGAALLIAHFGSGPASLDRRP
jgi:putative oxidoreductase